MTPQEWKEVEEKLKSIYSIVTMKCDQYEITLVLERFSQFKNVIMVYINKEFKGKWLSEDCEERRRFCRPITRSAYSAKFKKSIGKVSKKLREQYGLDKKFTCYSPWWTSFRSLKQHLIKNNNEIEIIRDL